MSKTAERYLSEPEAKEQGASSMVWLSSVSFASSYKWFLVLVLLLPDAIERIVPGGQKSTYWGAVFAIGAIWAVVGPAIFGSMSDRAGDRKKFMLAGSILTAFAVLVLYRASSILLLAVGYLLLQVSDDVTMGPYSALIPELFKPAERGKASGFMSMSMSIGQVAAVIMSLILAARTLPLYISIVTLNVLAAVFVIYLLRRHSGIQAGGTRKSWISAWADRDFRQVWLTRFFATLAFYFVIPYAEFFIQDMVPRRMLFGINLATAEQATAVLALTIAISTAVGAFVAGPLIDRRGRKPVAYMGAGLLSAGFLSMVTLPSFVWLWALAIIVGIGQGAFQSATWAMAADALPDPTALGRDMGLWQASISSVQIVSGLAGGLVTVGNALRMGLGYQVLFALAASSMAIAVLFTRRVNASA